MSPRLLTCIEKECAEYVVKQGTNDRWEYAAFLQSSNGPLLKLVTEKLPNRAEPTKAVFAAINKGAKIIVHHNHLSQESLSLADWNGVACLFEEIFAHSDDGSVYWGKALNRPAIEKMFGEREKHVMTAHSILSDYMRSKGFYDISNEVGERFAREVINRAMALRSYVEYSYQWGSLPSSASEPKSGFPRQAAGVLGAKFESDIDNAATNFAQLI